MAGWVELPSIGTRETSVAAFGDAGGDGGAHYYAHGMRCARCGGGECQLGDERVDASLLRAHAWCGECGCE